MAVKDVSFTISAQDKASAELKQIRNALADVSAETFTLGAVMSGLPAILAGISFVTIIKDLLDLGTATDATMRQIGASLPTGIEGLHDLSDAIDGVAESSGRSIESVRGAATEIAKLGVSSGGDLTERLRVAVEFADATGSNLQTTAAGVTTMMRTFNLSADQVEQVMANMASAAKGRVDVEELFNIFGRAAPQLQELGVDAKTATEAMVALINRGFNARKAGAFITQLDLDGIKQLAAEAPAATNALADMQAQAKLVEDGTGRATQALKDRLGASLAELGTKLLPPANAALQTFNNLLDLLVGKNWSQIMSNIAAFGAAGIAMPTFPTAPATPFGGGGGFDGHGSSASWGGPAAQRGPLPLTDAQKKTIDDLRASVAAYAQSVDDAGNRGEQAAAKVAELTKKIQESKMPTDEQTAAILSLNVALAKAGDQEAAKAFGDAMKSSLDLAGTALDRLNDKWNEEIARLEKDKTLQTDPAKAQAIQDVIDKLVAAQQPALRFAGAMEDAKTAFGTLQTAIAESKGNQDALDANEMAAIRLVDQWTDAVNNATPGTQQYTDAVSNLDKAKKLLQETFDAQDAQWKKAVKDAEDATKALEEHYKQVAETATAYGNLADSILSAGHSLGAFSQSTTATLENVIKLAVGVAQLAAALGSPGKKTGTGPGASAGDGAGSLVEGTAGAGAAAGGIVGGIIAGGSTGSIIPVIGTAVGAIVGAAAGIIGAAQQANAEHASFAAANTAALNKLSETIDTTGLEAISLSGDQIRAAQALTAGIAATSGKIIAENLTPGELNTLNDAADALGIKLNGSAGALQALIGALTMASKSVQLFGSDVASQESLGTFEAHIQGLAGGAAIQATLGAAIAASPALAALFHSQGIGSFLDAGNGNSVIAGLEALVQQVAGGGITNGMLGGLTAAQFTDTITKLFDAVTALPGVTTPGSLAAAVPTASVGGLASMSFSQGDEANSLLLAIRNATVDMRGFMASWMGGAGGGPVTMTIGQIGPNYIDGAVAAADVTSGVQSAVIAAVDQGLAGMRMNLRAAAGAPKGR